MSMTILDEIDELIVEIKETYADMEKMYAVYLPHFPLHCSKIDKLNQILNEWEFGPRGPRHDAEPGKELMNQKDMLGIQEHIAHHRSLRMTYADGMQPMDKKQFTLRMLFRKINQLCHPDKTKKFGRKIVLALRECFDDAQNAYERRDYHMLELAYIRTCYLRDELDRLDATEVAKVKSQLEGLKLDKQGMMLHPLYIVLASHRMGNIEIAVGQFNLFLNAHVDKLNAAIAEMQAKKAGNTQNDGAQ